MSVSIVTFANLGKKRNLKTADILPAIELFERKGVLRQVLCQLHSGLQLRHVQGAFPAYVRFPIRLFEKVSGIAIPRPVIDTIFDFFAALKLMPQKVVFLHGGHALPLTFRRARNKGSVVVDITVTAHPNANRRLEEEEHALLGLGELKGAFYEMSVRGAHCNEFDYVVAISDFVRITYIEEGFPSERIFTALPDIDIQRFTPQGRSDPTFRVLYMAFTTPLKGLQYLLDAWDSLELPNAELVLVGGYGSMPSSLKDEYDSRIRESKNTRWVGGSIAPEEYYRQASVLVFPSLTEGFGRVTLEAMACGIPVITTENARGIVEDGKTGFVVPIRDATAIREKIEYLYRNKDIAAAMGVEARKAVESKKPFDQSLFEIYKEILK